MNTLADIIVFCDSWAVKIVLRQIREYINTPLSENITLLIALHHPSLINYNEPANINIFKQLLTRGEYEYIHKYYDTHHVTIDKEMLLTHNETYSIQLHEYLSKQTEYYYSLQNTLRTCARYNNTKLMAHIFNQEKQKYKQVLSNIIPYNTENIVIEYCTLFDFESIIRNIAHKTVVEIGVYCLLIQNGCMLLDEMIDSILFHVNKPKAKSCIKYVLSKLEPPEIKTQDTEPKDFLKQFGIITPYINDSDSSDKLSTCAQSMYNVINSFGPASASGVAEAYALLRRGQHTLNKAEYFTIQTLIRCCKKYGYRVCTKNKYVLLRMINIIITREINDNLGELSVDYPVRYLMNGIITHKNWMLLSCKDKHNFLASHNITHTIKDLENAPYTFKKVIMNEQNKYYAEMIKYKKSKDMMNAYANN